jgi:hypothetical protein
MTTVQRAMTTVQRAAYLPSHRSPAAPRTLRDEDHDRRV